MSRLSTQTMTLTQMIIWGLFDIAMLAVLICAAADDQSGVFSRKKRIVSPVWQILILALAVAKTVTMFFVGHPAYFWLDEKVWGRPLLNFVSGAFIFGFYLLLYMIDYRRVKGKTEKMGVGGADAKIFPCLIMFMGPEMGVIMAITHAVVGFVYIIIDNAVHHYRRQSVPLMLDLAITFALVQTVWWIIKIF